MRPMRKRYAGQWITSANLWINCENVVDNQAIPHAPFGAFPVENPDAALRALHGTTPHPGTLRYNDLASSGCAIWRDSDAWLNCRGEATVPVRVLALEQS